MLTGGLTQTINQREWVRDTTKSGDTALIPPVAGMSYQPPQVLVSVCLAEENALGM